MNESNPYHFQGRNQSISSPKKGCCPKCGSCETKLIGWPSIYRSTGLKQENVYCLRCKYRFNASTGSANLRFTVIKNCVSYLVGIVFLLILAGSLLRDLVNWL